MSTARRQFAKATTGRDPYGQLHQVRRKQLLRALAAIGAAPCPICGQPMTASMGRLLHLDHSNPEAKLMGLPGDRLTHAHCNRSPRRRLDASKRQELVMNDGDVVVPRHKVCCDNCERFWNQGGQAPSRCW